MNRHRLLSGLAVHLAVLVAACATPLSRESRVHVGGASFVELRLPVAWEIRPVFGSGGSAERVRVFRGVGEVMQVVPMQWTNERTEADASRSRLLAKATAGLKERALCGNSAVQERVLREGVALYCTSQRTSESVVGVIATPRLTAAFAFLEPENAEVWQVLGTVRHFSFADAA